METTIHIVTKVQSDYDYYNPTALFATDNHTTAETYALKGDRVLTKLAEFYLDRLNHFQYYLDYENLTAEEDELFDRMYEIFNKKYEQFQRTYFRVDTVPFYLFNKNRYENKLQEDLLKVYGGFCKTCGHKDCMCYKSLGNFK